MDGLTLDTLMRQDKHVAPLFEGVFAADTLPRRLHKRPALIICNTDPVSKPGEHWVAFYVDKNGDGEFWDSYGMPPIIPQHRQFLDRLCRKWVYNHTSLQAIDSLVCGEYCVLYLIHRAHGYTLRRFVNMFFNEESPENNDRIVRTLFRRMFGRKRECVLTPTTSQRCCRRKR
jgi:hypothetical protein